MWLRTALLGGTMDLKNINIIHTPLTSITISTPFSAFQKTPSENRVILPKCFPFSFLLFWKRSLIGFLTYTIKWFWASEWRSGTLSGKYGPLRFQWIWRFIGVRQYLQKSFNLPIHFSEPQCFYTKKLKERVSSTSQFFLCLFTS